MAFRAFCLSFLAVGALVSVAHADATTTASALNGGPLPPVHIGPPPPPWPPHVPVDPIFPRPPLPEPQPIVPGRGCVPAPGYVCPG
jgi:hypothetical protein